MRGTCGLESVWLHVWTPVVWPWLLTATLVVHRNMFRKPVGHVAAHHTLEPFRS